MRYTSAKYIEMKYINKKHLKTFFKCLINYFCVINLYRFLGLVTLKSKNIFAYEKIYFNISCLIFDKL